MKNNVGKIIKVSGPLVLAVGLLHVKMYELVKVGKLRLLGEVVELNGDEASIQVYEETSGVMPGEPVEASGEPLSVELAPGLITSIYDGTQRPLEGLKNVSGSWIPRGIEVPSIDREKKWDFKPLVSEGDKVCGGDIIGEVKETENVMHKIMLPPNLNGEIKSISSGSFTVLENIALIKKENGEDEFVKMLQKWPVRIPRVYNKKVAPNELLVSGQRVIDTFFPVAKGGTASIPGPFGSGKTVVQHQLAKWAAVDIVVYVGCGERGNEMTDVLREFPELKDPRTGEPLIKRTVLIANTSNMPVAAREASVYTGITIAEYFRDMGYDVALMADSTSRWAEALREMSGRLEEMPGEEGYPAYLSTRIAEFYERSGKVICKGSLDKEREGTLSVIGAVSPPGGDLAEPVVQSTLRVVKVFWSLEAKLAFSRHFPAISWLRSYSLYLDNISEYYKNNSLGDFLDLRKQAMRILQEESSLEEIVRLVGLEALSKQDRLTMETALSLKEDFLHQNAFDAEDTYTSLEKQHLMLSIIINLHNLSIDQLEHGKTFDDIIGHSARENVSKIKFDSIEKLKEMNNEILSNDGGKYA